MKNKWNGKKIILLLLSFMLIFGTLIGCTNKVDEKPKDSQAVGQMEVVKDVVLAGNGSTKYCIVYDSSLEEGTMKEVNRLVRIATPGSRGSSSSLISQLSLPFVITTPVSLCSEAITCIGQLLFKH